jgi:pimeloyl-ACP methyl ester carboxylesterase
MSALWILLGIGSLFAAALLVGTFSLALPNPFRVFRNYGSPADWNLTPERVEIAKGIPGWFFSHATSREVVLVCHGRSRGKAFMLPLVDRLVGRWNVLVFDFPGHGETTYRWTTIGWREADAVEQALTFLERRAFSRIFIYGASQGGAAAMRSMARAPRASVRGLAVDGTFADLSEMLHANGRRFRVPAWFMDVVITGAGRLASYEPHRFRPASDIAAIHRPILVLHGNRDSLVPVDAAPKLAAAAGPNARLEVYDGGHDEPDSPRMQELLVAFFEELSVTAPAGEESAEPS